MDSLPDIPPTAAGAMAPRSNVAVDASLRFHREVRTRLGRLTKWELISVLSVCASTRFYDTPGLTIEQMREGEYDADRVLDTIRACMGPDQRARIGLPRELNPTEGR